MNKFRVKTKQGYYYEEGYGRYGRFNGSKLQAQIMCEEHADEIVDMIQRLIPGHEPEKESFPGHAPCERCK